MHNYQASSVPNTPVNYLVFEKVSNVNNYVCDLLAQYGFANKNISIEYNPNLASLWDKLVSLVNQRMYSFHKVKFFAPNQTIQQNNHIFADSAASLQEVLTTKLQLENPNFFAFNSLTNYDELFAQATTYQLYDDLIAKHGGLDLLVVQMHPNGQILFHQTTQTKELTTNGVIHKTNDFNQTLYMQIGLNQILQAKQVVVLGYGLENAAMVSKLFFSKDYDVRLPLCWLKNHPNLTVLLDQQAATGIFKHKYPNQPMVFEALNLTTPEPNVVAMPTDVRNDAALPPVNKDPTAVWKEVYVAKSEPQPLPAFANELQVENWNEPPVSKPAEIMPQPPVQEVVVESELASIPKAELPVVEKVESEPQVVETEPTAPVVITNEPVYEEWDEQPNKSEQPINITHQTTNFFITNPTSEVTPQETTVGVNHWENQTNLPKDEAVVPTFVTANQPDVVVPNYVTAQNGFGNDDELQFHPSQYLANQTPELDPNFSPNDFREFKPLNFDAYLSNDDEVEKPVTTIDEPEPIHDPLLQLEWYDKQIKRNMHLFNEELIKDLFVDDDVA